jgi:tetratricopeptide (TPR) repeat protein
VLLLLLGSCGPSDEVLPPVPPDLAGMEPGVRQAFERLRAEYDLRAQSDEERAAALAALGHWYLLYSQPEVALDLYAAAARLEPDDFRYPYFAGIASMRHGEPAVAQRHFERALELEPDHTPVRVYLGEALLDQGQLTAARREVLAAVDDPAAEPRARVVLGRLALEVRSIGEAVAQLETAQRLAPDSRQVRFLLGTAYRRAGRIDEARPLLGESVAGVRRFSDLPEDPWVQEEVSRVRSDSKAYTRRAERRASAGRYREAAEEYRRALAAAGTGDATIRNNLVRVLLRAGRIDEARREVEELRRAAPESPLTAYSSGALAQAEGRLADARAHYARSVELDPALITGRDALAELLFREARWEEALPHYRWLVDHQPANPSFRHREALTLLLLGRTVEARNRLSHPGAAGEDPRLSYLLVRTLAALPSGGVGVEESRRLLIETLSGRLRLFESETLAMFHRAQGDTQGAIFWQEVAVHSARRLGRSDLIQRAESRLERYRSGLPVGPVVVPGEHSEDPALPPGTLLGRPR